MTDKASCDDNPHHNPSDTETQLLEKEYGVKPPTACEGK